MAALRLLTQHIPTPRAPQSVAVTFNIPEIGSMGWT
jgi:hypothetical protein